MTEPVDEGPRPPLFLEREAYQRRRMADAARLLPMIGALLWLLPLLWWGSSSSAPSLSSVMVYVFSVWIGLILLAMVISPRLRVSSAPPVPPAADTAEEEPRRP